MSNPEAKTQTTKNKLIRLAAIGATITALGFGAKSCSGAEELKEPGKGQLVSGKLYLPNREAANRVEIGCAERNLTIKEVNSWKDIFSLSGIGLDSEFTAPGNPSCNNEVIKRNDKPYLVAPLADALQ